MSKCSCSCDKQRPASNSPLGKSVSVAGLGLLLWWAVYLNLAPFSQWLTYQIFHLPPGEHFSRAMEFFFFDTPKVLMLLVLIVFVLGIVHTFFSPQRTRKMLAGKSQFWGNILAAGLGVVTPFCSCSAVPLFIGFVTSGVPLGVTFSFLISAPLVNEVALVLLFGLFGWKVALLYLCTGLVLAIVSGWALGRLKLEKYVEEWVYQTELGREQEAETIDWNQRIQAGYDSVGEIVGKVWLYIILGIGIGAWIHGYVPEGLLAGIMGKAAWWSVPLAVLLGIPMYSNAAGIIPVVQALLSKGAALGTVLAFMMSVIGLSLPEIIILRKVLKPQLIGVFIGIVGFGILLVGYLFNLLPLEQIIKP